MGIKIKIKKDLSFNLHMYNFACSPPPKKK